MPRPQSLSALVVCVAVVACGPPHDQSKTLKVEASYTGTVSPSGETSVHKSTPAVLAELKETTDVADEVNKLFPPPQPPRGMKGSSLANISDDGVFHLADGDTVYMDGLSCTNEGLDNLRKVLIDKDTTVVIAHRSPGTPAPAELWSATQWQGFKEPAYSPFPETAISSGWCNPVASPTNPYAKRYQALAEKFGALRERMRSNNRWRGP
jgi:hypothetical protein